MSDQTLQLALKGLLARLLTLLDGAKAKAEDPALPALSQDMHKGKAIGLIAAIEAVYMTAGKHGVATSSLSPALRCGALVKGNGLAEWMILHLQSRGVETIQMDSREVCFFRWSDDGAEVWTYVHSRCSQQEAWARADIRPPPLVAEHLRTHKGRLMDPDAIDASRAPFQARLEPALLEPGRYRSPDGVEGTLRPFDTFANCYTFAPDGWTPRAVVGPGFPDGLTRIGKGAVGWVRLGDVKA
jgi:hypothetical protein